MMNGGCLAADRINALSEPTNKDLLNPFVHHLELTTTYEKIKVNLCVYFNPCNSISVRVL